MESAVDFGGRWKREQKAWQKRLGKTGVGGELEFSAGSLGSEDGGRSDRSRIGVWVVRCTEKRTGGPLGEALDAGRAELWVRRWLGEVSECRGRAPTAWQ